MAKYCLRVFLYLTYREVKDLDVAAISRLGQARPIVWMEVPQKLLLTMIEQLLLVFFLLYFHQDKLLLGQNKIEQVDFLKKEKEIFYTIYEIGVTFKIFNTTVAFYSSTLTFTNFFNMCDAVSH